MKATACTATHQAGQVITQENPGTRYALILPQLLSLVKISACPLILILLHFQQILPGLMQALKNQASDNSSQTP